MPPTIKKFFTKDGYLRISAAVTTDLVKEMATTLELNPLSAVGMGRLATGTLLMASQLNDGQSLSIRVHGDGAIGHLCAEASFEAKVRGYCQNPEVDITTTREGKLDLGSAIGNGYISVARSQPFQKEPQIGIVPLLSGEIGEDLAFYMQQSQQVPCVVALAVTLGKNAAVAAAGGVFIEVMPGTPDAIISSLESKAIFAEPLSKLLAANASEREMVELYSHSSELVENVHPFPIQYFCPCTLERVERTLVMLGKEALADFIHKGKDVEVKCEFCKKNYNIPLARVETMLFDFEQPN